MNGPNYFSAPTPAELASANPPTQSPSLSSLAYGSGVSSGTDSRLYRVERGNVFLRGGTPVKNFPLFNGQQTYTGVSSSATDGNGNIDPTQPGVLTLGSIPPTVNQPNFTFTANSPTQLVITWKPYPLKRADGFAVQLTSVPSMGSISTLLYSIGRIQIDGLVASTLYTFYPFWSEAAQKIGWCAGLTSSVATGTPNIAFTTLNPLELQTQNLVGNIPLGAIQFTMPSSGSSSGSSGGADGSGSGTGGTGGGSRPINRL